jgi:hypothetical protein
MNEHNGVASWEPVDNDEEYLYVIRRTRGLPDVRVHLSTRTSTRGPSISRARRR